MKTILLCLLTLVLIACGEQPQEENPIDSIGEQRALKGSDVLNKEELVELKFACNALAKKATYLSNIMVNTSKKVGFKLKKKACSSDEEDVKDVTSVVRESSGKYVLNNDDLYFKKVLTDESSYLETLCDSVEGVNIVSTDVKLKRWHHVIDGKVAAWYAFYDNDSQNCNGAGSSNNQNCMYIRIGEKDSGSNKYTIKQVEVYKIELERSSLKEGFVVDRAMYEGCADDEESQSRVMQTLTKI